MKFTKMQGAGNDYVYVDCTQNELKNASEVAVAVSDRHFGIGSDGLILIKKSDKADFFMEMYNADGSQGSMCGNGIRCVGKYVYDNGLTDKAEITVETLSGIKTLQLYPGSDGKVKTVRVNMGAPILQPEQIPADIHAFKNAENLKNVDKLVAQPISVDGKDYEVTCVSMGNPHCVTFLTEDVRTFDLDTTGPLFENHPAFPNRINAEFVNVLDHDTIRMRVWERGSGETLACGTGACASAVASILNGHTGKDVTVKLLGGDLKISWEGEGTPVYMTGPAEIVFDGEIDWE